jgi:hypothetical protein
LRGYRIDLTQAQLPDNRAIDVDVKVERDGHW